VSPFFTPEWGDIPAERWRIHPRAKPVAFCCRGTGAIEHQANYNKYFEYLKFPQCQKLYYL